MNAETLTMTAERLRVIGRATPHAGDTVAMSGVRGNGVDSSLRADAGI